MKDKELSDLICSECGRALKHPIQGENGKIYGPVCIEKVGQRPLYMSSRKKINKSEHEHYSIIGEL